MKGKCIWSILVDSFEALTKLFTNTIYSYWLYKRVDRLDERGGGLMELGWRMRWSWRLVSYDGENVQVSGWRSWDGQV